MEAKIITYDSVAGAGTLITKENEKKSFTIDEWNDFNTLPEVGLCVVIDNDKLIVQKQVIDEAEQKLALLKIKREKYLNGSIANGWRLVNQNEDGFVIQETNTSALAVIFLFIVLSVLFALLLGFWGVLLSLLLIVVLRLGETVTTLKGVTDKEKFTINITKNNKPYKQLVVNDEDINK